MNDQRPTPQSGDRLAAVVILSGWFLIIWFASGGSVLQIPLFFVGYAWLPGLVAVIAARRAGLSIPVLGRPNLWWLIAWFSPLVLLAATVVLSLPLAEFSGLTELRAKLPPTVADASALSLVALFITQSLIAAATANLVFALGGELFWRGYLWAAYRGLGFWPASLRIGLAWGLWYAPLILLTPNPETPVWASIALAVAFSVLLTPSLLWLRLQGGAVIVPALFQGSVTALSGLLPLLFVHASSLLVGFTGLSGLAALAAVNFALRRWARDDQATAGV